MTPPHPPVERTPRTDPDRTHSARTAPAPPERARHLRRLASSLAVTAALAGAAALAGSPAPATASPTDPDRPGVRISTNVAATRVATPAPRTTPSTRAAPQPRTAPTPPGKAAPRVTATSRTAPPRPAPAPRTGVTTANSDPANRLALTNRLGLGVQFHGLWSTYDDASRAAVLDALAAAGAEWVRIDVGWPTLQSTGPATYDEWYVRLVDRTLAAVDQRGLKVLLTFWQTPAWANGNAGLTAPPDRPSDFARALGWAAGRWGASVDAWEVWNEPNATAYLTGADPATYTKMLCAAYPALKQADPDSPVVFGGLQYNDDAWLEKAYVAGARPCFDVMATHPYVAPSNSAPTTRDDGTVWGLGHVASVRATMARHDDAAKAIWFTEFGWSTGTSPDGRPWNLGVTPTQQAEYLTRTVELVRAAFPYVQAMFWYRDRDGVSGDPHEDQYGLMTADLVPKPALAALRTASAGTTFSPYSRTPTRWSWRR